MQSELVHGTWIESEEFLQWEIHFQRRCKAELADAAMGTQNYSKENELYSTTLSLDIPDRVDTLLQRNKARIMMKSWEDPLHDADKVVELEPPSHLGYERQYVALHGARRYAEGVESSA